MSYKRWNVEKAIVLALRELGGTASRKIIRQTIATNEYVNLKYEDVYDTKVMHGPEERIIPSYTISTLG